MARIPPEEIDRIKREVSLQRLVGAHGVELKRHGKDWIGLCPFHADTSPSLVVSPKENLWNCLGACQQGGSVIDWVMKANGLSFRHAVELLREDPSLARSGTGKVRQSTVQHLDGPFDATMDDTALMHAVINYYHARLKQNPDALQYLQKRGLNHPEMLSQFRLGFSDRTLGYRIPQKNRQAGAELRGRLQKLGILRQNGHEHFRGAVVFPVLDAQGQVKEMYGRRIAEVKRGAQRHLYLPGQHRGVFNLVALKASREVILCESIIDALTFWCAGYRNVTASYGINGFTQEHFEAFMLNGVQRVLIAYDNDEAGNKAAQRLSEKLLTHSLDCYRIQFPMGKDANAFAMEAGSSAPNRLGDAIRQAVWRGKGRPRTTRACTAELQPEAKPEDETQTGAQEAPIPARPPPAASAPVEAEPDEPVAEQVAETPKPNTLAAEKAAPSLQPPQTKPEPPPAAQESAEPQELTPPRAPEPPPQDEPRAMREPPAPKLDVQAEVNGDEATMRFGDRRWRIRGLNKNLSYEQIRVNVLCARVDTFHVDTFDLYSARHRQAFIKQAAEELRLKESIIKQDLGRVFLKLEELQDALIKRTLEPEQQSIVLTEKQRNEALELLESPDLIQRILRDFERCGVVGEESNKLAAYLTAVSRKHDKPLAVVIQSSSAAGKSSLMEAVLSFLPEEERVKYSAMTGQSLFYMGETDLEHKVLAIAEERGAERATYALKLLQSEGELTIASTGKDPQTGRLTTQEYHVKGPVAIFLTTTSVEVDDELLNRCLVLSINEDREQTRAIHRMQRREETLDGLFAREDRQRIIEIHQNAHRLLRPLGVHNPYAESLTFADDKTRMRRDQKKYLALIRAIALLRQYQKAVRRMQRDGVEREYVEVEREDIELANHLAHEVMGRSLDELPPQTRRFLKKVHTMVDTATRELDIKPTDYRFTRRQVFEVTGLGLTQVKLHMERLIDHEYVLVHRGGRGQQFVYELCYDGEGEERQRFMLGLIDVASLKGKKGANDNSTTPNLTGSEANLTGFETNLTGQKGQLTGSYRAHDGGLSGGYRGAKNGGKARPEGVCGEIVPLNSKTHYSGEKKQSDASYHSHIAPIPARPLL